MAFPFISSATRTNYRSIFRYYFAYAKDARLMHCQRRIVDASIRLRNNTRIPIDVYIAHEMCFLMHDIMAQLLQSGAKRKAFWTSIDLRDGADRDLLENSDVFSWLKITGRQEEQEKVLFSAVFPAVLGDMLSSIYESLECSRKEKLVQSFMLLRKPIQESLFLFEAMALDASDFAKTLTETPEKLYSGTAGGQEAYTKRIQAVLKLIGQDEAFDAAYLASLRYDKWDEDSFAGLCDQAIHLFTKHDAIRTEPMNINMIFSDRGAHITQWKFLYSRLPYIMVYTYRLVEYLCSKIVQTSPEYLADMDGRVSARVLLWWPKVEDNYADVRLEQLAKITAANLRRHCLNEGMGTPSYRDLVIMGSTGAFPAESIYSVWRRRKSFERSAS